MPASPEPDELPNCSIPGPPKGHTGKVLHIITHECLQGDAVRCVIRAVPEGSHLEPDDYVKVKDIAPLLGVHFPTPPNEGPQWPGIGPQLPPTFSSVGPKTTSSTTKSEQYPTSIKTTGSSIVPISSSSSTQISNKSTSTSTTSSMSTSPTSTPSTSRLTSTLQSTASSTISTSSLTTPKGCTKVSRSTTLPVPNTISSSGSANQSVSCPTCRPPTTLTVTTTTTTTTAGSWTPSWSKPSITQGGPPNVSTSPSAPTPSISSASTAKISSGTTVGGPVTNVHPNSQTWNCRPSSTYCKLTDPNAASTITTSTSPTSSHPIYFWRGADGKIHHMMFSDKIGLKDKRGLETATVDGTSVPAAAAGNLRELHRHFLAPAPEETIAYVLNPNNPIIKALHEEPGPTSNDVPTSVSTSLQHTGPETSTPYNRFRFSDTTGSYGVPRLNGHNSHSQGDHGGVTRMIIVGIVSTGVVVLVLVLCLWIATRNNNKKQANKRAVEEGTAMEKI